MAVRRELRVALEHAGDDEVLLVGRQLPHERRLLGEGADKGVDGHVARAPAGVRGSVGRARARCPRSTSRRGAGRRSPRRSAGRAGAGGAPGPRHPVGLGHRRPARPRAREGLGRGDAARPRSSMSQRRLTGLRPCRRAGSCRWTTRGRWPSVLVSDVGLDHPDGAAAGDDPPLGDEPAVQNGRGKFIFNSRVAKLSPFQAATRTRSPWRRRQGRRGCRRAPCPSGSRDAR